MTPEDMARYVIDERLRDQPETRRLYLTDATFHAAVEPARVALVAVARALESRGLRYLTLGLLRDAAADLLDDQQLAAQTRREDHLRRYADLMVNTTSVRLGTTP
jgi:hypothetical protein